VFEFNLLPEEGHKCPAFINLQQPYFEKFLVDRVREAQAQGAPIELRGKNRVENVE
ncbi:MAG: FAD-dependent oxidoreductase, partial [Gammaproteobacteria bacterium]|nr:FAD-dependent oxidoreductase [Gammaproteobacteria bacterium]NIU03387.1 FAD-dependent oxidoreductase [Gammaproteobacteria bacterium]NIV76429.1 FAD-dependent oxidoreductase [Gammaproteobacteria bacterium]NIX84662.1 FAD-dependent oxidoreductase [Gammaproteobacteria bacterium]